MEVEFSERARSHLAAIKEYLRQQDQALADNIGCRIRAAVEVLGDFPNVGRVGRSPATRELVVRRLPYVVVYEVNLADGADEVMVLGIFHTAQDR